MSGSMPIIEVETSPVRYIEEEKSLNTSDLIFKEWEEFQSNIIESLNNDQQLNIEKSSLCLSKSLSSKIHFTSNSHCKGCKKVKTFLENYYLNDNNEFLVYSGENKGTVIKLFSIKHIDTYLDYDSENLTTENPFINYILISCVLNNLLINYPTKISFLWGYICRDKFNVLVNSKVMKSMREISLKSKFSKSSPLSSIYNRLNFDISTQIFNQLVCLCHYHKGYSFSHGEPSYAYINFNVEPVSFTYRNIKLNSQLMLCISPSIYSSITYKHRRIYKKDKNVFGEMVEYQNKEWFKIGNRGEKFIEMRRNGIYKYFDFDFIMFFASLIIDKSFPIDEILKHWKDIWKTEEYEKIMKDLKTIKTNNFDNIFGVLKNYHMKFKCLDKTIENLDI